MERLVPEQFAELARLSDLLRAEHVTVATVTGTSEALQRLRANLEKERLGGTPRQVLDAHLKAMSDESFKELTGWVLFGRQYTPLAGDPTEILAQYIKRATVFPRHAQVGYLERKPIGEYLRAAMKHIETTTSEDIARAQRRERGEYEEVDEVEEDESD
jgi:hypothetical protein